MKKRIAIFIFYDRDGIVDDYVVYLLKCLKTVCERIIVISNVLLMQEEQIKMEPYISQIFFRENRGYDVGAYKEAIINYLGFEELSTYDELVLMNDTVYGPFRPFIEIFSDMENRSCDFWGITKQAKTYMGYGEIDDNIQSYFLVFHRSVIQSEAFQKYWTDLVIPDRFIKVCQCFENKITGLLSTVGFSWDTYVHSDDLNTESAKTNFNHFAYCMGQLVEKYHMPFLKKKPFVLYDFCHTSQMELRRALNYVSDKTSYDTGLIWSNLLRTYSIDILESTLGLQEVITSCQKDNNRYENAILIIYIESERTLLWITDILADIKNCIRIHIVYSNKKIENCLKEFPYAEKEYMASADRYNAVFVTEVCLDNYDYVCYVHDDPVTITRDGLAVEYTYMHETVGNLLGNISEICSLFEKNNCLGLIKRPQSLFSFYWNHSRKILDENNLILKQFAKENAFFDHISWGKNISFVEGGFWCRSEILTRICQSYVDYKSVMMLFPYVIQKEKYYTITVLRKDYAQNRLANLSYMVETMKTMVIAPWSEKDYSDTNRSMMYASVVERMKKYRCAYVYGAGEIAEREVPVLKKKEIKIEGVIVSSIDGMSKQFMGLPIFQLSKEIPFDNDACVFLAMNPTNQLEIMPNLTKYIDREQIFCL